MPGNALTGLLFRQPCGNACAHCWVAGTRPRQDSRLRGAHGTTSVCFWSPCQRWPSPPVCLRAAAVDDAGPGIARAGHEAQGVPGSGDGTCARKAASGAGGGGVGCPGQTGAVAGDVRPSDRHGPSTTTEVAASASADHPIDDGVHARKSGVTTELATPAEQHSPVSCRCCVRIQLHGCATADPMGMCHGWMSRLTAVLSPFRLCPQASSWHHPRPDHPDRPSLPRLSRARHCD